MPTNAITIRNFTKRFGDVEVIRDLSFEVKEGEIFAFLGANGSGKTTTIRCLLGIYEATAGELLVYGKPYTTQESTYLGYLPEERGLYTSAKALEALIYFGRIKGMAEPQARAAALAFLKRVGLEDKANVQISKLSSGQQQKIQLGITVINSPKLLILDEPTKGLDPVNRSLLLDILMELNEAGSTIVFSTHQMEEAERIADRMLMIKNGKAALYGEVKEVKRQFGTNTLHVQFSGKLPEGEGMYTARVEHNSAEITPAEGITPDEILNYLLSEQLSINKFELASPSLNEIFIKVSSES